MSRIASIILILLVISCKKDVNNIPSYVSINSIALFSGATDNITDAWVYIDDNLQGVYELPANFPVLAEGKHSLRVRAGIKDNGIAGTRIAYPFYTSYIIDEQDFNSTQTLIVEPEVNYLNNAKFFIEDFESSGIKLEETLISDTSIIKLQDTYNKYGGGILIDSLITFEIATTEQLSDLPQEGAPVYLELDYKCNTRFLVGLYVNFPSAVLQKDLLWINPKDDWNKIYVNLTSSISESVGADYFSIFIAMKRDFAIDTNMMYFDNLRVVY